ncbi:uncharacterized protein KQ657_000623 [Scheffersomyces spartinae]|uniref:Uncharacterized protein n=1 Tax=Scheffersomyces spartinae TaxID=45513 RepID=A0A9P7V988_9ASCO|nr:uncharacterized protein KQ657_000623 [Scheffersomyces spartinae]KAG7193554.1 hypothetical protein KQ657_000623 [Scheffersomyces spartinae]
MAKTCRTFKTIIYKHVLYARMVFPTMHSFQKYTEYHLPHLGLKFQLTAPSDCVNYLQSVVLVNPPVRPRKDMGTNIAGSYIIDDNDCDIKRSGLSYEDFLRSFNAILKEAYGLKSITINEISPHFAFPDTWDDDKGGLSKFRKRGQKMKKTLNKLQLSTQSGWTVPFRLGHISGILAEYDTINELILRNFIVDDIKLTSFTIPSGQQITINKVTFMSCTFSNSSKNRRKASELFSSVTSVQLSSILSANDLSMIDFMKANHTLLNLIIDFDSPVFYSVNEMGERLFDFIRFNSFFKLVCSGQGGYKSVKELILTNFDLFKHYIHVHKKNGRSLATITEEEEEEGKEEEEEDHEQQDNNREQSPSDVDRRLWYPHINANYTESPILSRPRDDTFDALLSNLAPVPSLTFILKVRPELVHTCARCGFTKTEVDTQITSLNNNDWWILLSPLLHANESCHVKIMNTNFQVIFERFPNST